MSHILEDKPAYGRLEGIWVAEFAADVVNINDPAFVIMESFSHEHSIGPCRWATRGGSLPEKGMDCLVGYDENETPYVVAWWDGTGGTPIITDGSLEGRKINWHTGSSPPSSPQTGDVWNQVWSGGINQLFRYDPSLNGATYPWGFIGGSPLFQEVGTNENTASSTYAALATAGPSITPVRPGDFDVEIGFNFNNANPGTMGIMSYDIGGTGAVDVDAVFAYNAASADIQTHVARMRRKTGLAASVTLTAKYKSGNGLSSYYQNRWMKVTPVRVG